MPKNYTQRVVAFVVGLLYVMAAILAIASSVLFKTQLATDLHSKAAAVVFSFFLVCVVLAGSIILIFLGVRLLRGALRTSAKRA